jgi:hypothetical protein
MKKFANSNKRWTIAEMIAIGAYWFLRHQFSDTPHIKPSDLLLVLPDRSEASRAALICRLKRYSEGWCYNSDINKKTGAINIKEISMYRNILLNAGLNVPPITAANVTVMDKGASRSGRTKRNDSANSSAGQTFNLTLIDQSLKILPTEEKLDLSFKASTAAYNAYLRSLNKVQIKITTARRYFNGLFNPSKGYENGPPALYVWFIGVFTGIKL